MVLIRPWDRKLVSCRQVLALIGDSPKWISQPCVLQMSLKQKGWLKCLSAVLTVLAGQEGGRGKDWMPVERKHIPLTGKKLNLFYLSWWHRTMDWEERRSWSQPWELGLDFWRESLTCPSLIFLSLSFPPVPLWWETKSAPCLSVWVLRHSLC